MRRPPTQHGLLLALLVLVLTGGFPPAVCVAEPGLVPLSPPAQPAGEADASSITGELQAPSDTETLPSGEDEEPPSPATETDAALGDLLERLLPGGALAGPLSAAITIGVVSLAPAALLMTTCYVRFSVVLSLVRQGLGTQGMPSNQIVASLALFLSAMVMWPIWTEAWRAGGEPYQAGQLELTAAVDQGSLPVRRWMARQIEAAGNRDTVLMFLQRHPTAAADAATYDDVPTEALLPAFLVSELETAFMLGVRLLIPFLLIDLVVATLVVSSGLVMLPPTVVSLPLKLLVFVMADGWTLVVTSLLDGVSATGL